MGFGRFEIKEGVARDGTRRLTLVGELDLGTAPVLRERLKDLALLAEPVRLDLSQLAFADSTGMGALVAATEDAREHRWRLEIDRSLSAQVATLVELWGAAPYFWPDD